MRLRWAILVGVVTAAALAAATSQPAPVVRLNQIQVVGTHNSYHLAPSGPLADVEDGADLDDSGLEYEHAPLVEQLTRQGVRQLELDVWADPKGDRWAPKGLAGFKVFHAPDDTGSTCDLLVSCLTELRSWSRAHPAHLPVAVMIEPKDLALLSRTRPVTITAARLDELDAEIRSVFRRPELVTPDDVRSGSRTLERAVLTKGWPTVAESRGRFLFVLLGHRSEYVEDHPSLERRVMFTPSWPGQPDAAFIKVDDPTGRSAERIRRLVARGYVVRTRADYSVETPVSGDFAQRAVAFASGAQWVSTDYPVAGMARVWGSSYVASLPGRRPGEVARCNPVSAPLGCDDAQLVESVDPPRQLTPWWFPGPR